MVTYAYKDTQGRNLTEFAYQKHKKEGKDVSGYTSLSAPVTPTAPTAPNQPGTIPTNTATTPTTPELPKIVQEGNNYRLGSQLFSSQSAAQAGLNRLMNSRLMSQQKTPTAPTAPNQPGTIPTNTATTPTTPVADTTTTAPTTSTYDPGFKGDPTLKPIEGSDAGIQLYKGNPDYQDNSEQRLNEISGNIKSYYKSNPMAFDSYQKFKDFFHYDERIPQQKMVLDSFWKEKTTSDMFSGMSASDIGSSIASGNFSNSDLDALRGLNPDLYGQVQSYLNTYNSYNSANSNVSGSRLDIVRAELGIEAPEDIDLMAKYNELVNTDEIKGYQEKINTLKGQIEQVDEKIFSMRDSLESQYDGTGINKDVLDAILADRVEALNKEKRTLQIDYNTNLNQYDSLYKAGTDTFGVFKDQIELDRQQWQDSMQQLGFYYQYTPQGMEEYATAQYMAASPNMDTATSPEQQIMALNQALDGYYADFGDIIQRPQARVVSDVMAYAKQNNIPLSQALKENFVKPLQGKPEYKATISNKYGMNAQQTIQEIGGKTYMVTQNPDGTISYSLMGGGDGVTTTTQGGATYETVDGITISRGLETLETNYTDGGYGGQCGAFANNYAETLGLGRIFKDPFSQKDDYINSQEAKIGSFIMWQPSGSKYGHVGVVVGVNGDSILIKDSNGVKGKDGKYNETVATRTVSLKSVLSQNGGFFDPTKAGTVKTDTLGGIDSKVISENASTFEAYLDKGKEALGTTEALQLSTLESMGYPSMKEFNNDYYKRLQIKADEPADPGLITALEYVTENPLFDYTDSNGVKQKGLLGEQGIIDSMTIAKIEDNLMKGNSWNDGLGLKTIFKLNKYTRIGDFAESLRTIRNSKVIDIVKTGKVKLYPMSDTDIGLLAGSVGLQIQSFAQPNKAKQTMKALQSLLNKYKNQSGENQTIDDII